MAAEKYISRISLLRFGRPGRLEPPHPASRHITGPNNSIRIRGREALVLDRMRRHIHPERRVRDMTSVGIVANPSLNPDRLERALQERTDV